MDRGSHPLAIRADSTLPADPALRAKAVLAAITLVMAGCSYRREITLALIKRTAVRRSRYGTAKVA